ncbi:MAG: hypothetical protein PHH11_17745, partial [Methylomonas sp.]|nr:hypothetical protein [Methylomonas sp.]
NRSLSMFLVNAMRPKGAYFAQDERLSLPLCPVLNEKPYFSSLVAKISTPLSRKNNKHTTKGWLRAIPYA